MACLKSLIMLWFITLNETKDVFFPHMFACVCCKDIICMSMWDVQLTNFISSN